MNKSNNSKQVLDTTMIEERMMVFLKRFSGTHKLSELNRMFGSGTREALESMEKQNKIKYHVDEDPRFSGYMIESEISERYIPSLQPGTLPGQIAKLLEDGPRTKQEIFDHFKGKRRQTIVGRLSEMSKAGQIIKNNGNYRLKPKSDEL